MELIGNTLSRKMVMIIQCVISHCALYLGMEIILIISDYYVQHYNKDIIRANCLDLIFNIYYNYFVFRLSKY